MLAKVVQSKKSTWSAFVDTCVFSYNSSKHDSSKFTPFELMFGRLPTLPIDVELRKASPEEVVANFALMPQPNIDQKMDEMQVRLEEAKCNIVAAQMKQKENYDAKHSKPNCFQEGENVLKKDVTRKKKMEGSLTIGSWGHSPLRRSYHMVCTSLLPMMAKMSVLPVHI